MDLYLKGKTVIVTGGGSGLGKGICEAFACEGANVVINYIVDELEVVKFTEQLNGKYKTDNIAVYGDITKAEEIQSVINKATDRYRHVDVLVNNAAIRPTTLLKDMDDNEWDKVIDINLNAAFKFCKRIVNHFLDNKIKGHIVNIISKAAYSVTSPGHSHYAASKAGMLMLTKALANEVAGMGITVNGVAPGIIRTSMMERKLEDKSLYEDYMQRIRIRRLADEHEVGAIVAFLASERCELITGTCVDISGGMLI